MTKLSDTQAILLSTAAQRTDGSLLPLPGSIKPNGGSAKAIDALLNRGFAEERETVDRKIARRTDDDRHFGVFITTAGASAIGIILPGAALPEEGNQLTAAEDGASPKRANKSEIVLDLLRRPNGATLAELIEATGWLPHSTRAALTGLRKKGRDIVRGKRDEVTSYSLVAAK